MDKIEGDEGPSLISDLIADLQSDQPRARQASFAIDFLRCQVLLQPG